MKKVSIPYEFGEKVYMKCDPDQLEYVIVGFILQPNQLLMLRISFCGEMADVYEFEISREKDIDKPISKNDDENI